MSTSVKRENGNYIVDRADLQAKINELMRQLHDDEIDYDTYSQAMMELTTSAQE